jgi:hypothetical protein
VSSSKVPDGAGFQSVEAKGAQHAQSSARLQRPVAAGRERQQRVLPLATAATVATRCIDHRSGGGHPLIAICTEFAFSQPLRMALRHSLRCKVTGAHISYHAQPCSQNTAIPCMTFLASAIQEDFRNEECCHHSRATHRDLRAAAQQLQRRCRRRLHRRTACPGRPGRGGGPASGTAS